MSEDTSFIRRHHIYKNICFPFVGEELIYCIKEAKRSCDRKVVTVIQNNLIKSQIMGSIPLKYSTVSAKFLPSKTSYIILYHKVEEKLFRSLWLESVT